MSVSGQGQSTDPLPRATPESVGLRTEPLAASTALLRRLVDERKIAGAVAMLARNGRLAHVAAVGYQDLETRTPMTERSIFRIYSMTKPVTAVAVMMLFEQGRFGLDDPVSKYLPEFASVGSARTPMDGRIRRLRAITIRDLLLHTSGLNHRTSDMLPAGAGPIALDRAAAVRAEHRPSPADGGARHALPLQRVDHRARTAGRDLVRSSPSTRSSTARIFRPLRMTDTGFYATPAQRSRLATVYGPGGRLADCGRWRSRTLPFTETPALLEGAVGLVSTGPDFLRFSQMLLQPR